MIEGLSWGEEGNLRERPRAAASVASVSSLCQKLHTATPH